MIARTYKSELTLILITIGIVSLMVFLNDVNLHIRIKELRLYMQKSTGEDNNIDHIGLVMKYRLQKKIYENQLYQDEADIIEARVNSILSKTTTDRNVSIERYQYLSIPSLFIINLFRRITNKEPIQNVWDDAANVYLAIAYYYERNNCFARALDIYTWALKEETYNTNTIASIILHEGYCHSIMGNYRIARNKYLYVIKNYGDKPVAITALILLRYLEGFRSELDRVLKYDKDSLEKSEKLCKLIAYRDALKVITKIENKSNPADRPRIMYIKGMCFEGLSEKEKAIDTYQNIINENIRSPYARLANRRIYIAGYLATNGEKLKNLAVGNNQMIRDPVFDKMVDQETRLRLPEGQENAAIFQKELAKEESRYPVLNIEKLKFLTMVERAAPIIGDQSKKEAPAITVRVNTIQGDIFIGSIQQDTKEYIILATMIGTVKIPKNKIVSLQRIK
jgi:tetratricopeptide (TPR) repeat protein